MVASNDFSIEENFEAGDARTEFWNELGLTMKYREGAHIAVQLAGLLMIMGAIKDAVLMSLLAEEWKAKSEYYNVRWNNKLTLLFKDGKELKPPGMN